MRLQKEKIKISEIIWLFVIGCLVGFVLETIWHFLKNGVWINKQGLLYGPFKPIYGFGLIFIVLIMNNYREKKFWQKFIIGVILGSAFEYFGSLFQEYVFGTSTWNYSNYWRTYLFALLLCVGNYSCFLCRFCLPVFKENIK